jgi:hypothetical protein
MAEVMQRLDDTAAAGQCYFETPFIVIILSGIFDKLNDVGKESNCLELD